MELGDDATQDEDGIRVDAYGDECGERFPEKDEGEPSSSVVTGRYQVAAVAFWLCRKTE